MLGKPLSAYLAFAKPVLALIAVVWLLRLGLSMAGIPVGAVRFVSVTGVVLLGALYFGWAVGQKGFGSFKQLYGLNLIQGIFSQTLVALAPSCTSAGHGEVSGGLKLRLLVLGEGSHGGDKQHNQEDMLRFHDEALI